MATVNQQVINPGKLFLADDDMHLFRCMTGLEIVRNPGQIDLSEITCPKCLRRHENGNNHR